MKGLTEQANQNQAQKTRSWRIVVRMTKTYRNWEPEQSWLLPPSPSDWLEENDLVYFLLDTVRELDISGITAKYEAESRGFPPYHPPYPTLLKDPSRNGAFPQQALDKCPGLM